MAIKFDLRQGKPWPWSSFNKFNEEKEIDRDNGSVRLKGPTDVPGSSKSLVVWLGDAGRFKF